MTEPPRDVAAERGLIGSILVDGESFGLISQIVDKDDFTLDSHRVVFCAVQRLFQRGQTSYDATIVFDELKSSGDVDDCGGLDGLVDLIDSVPNAAHVEYYAKIVRDKAVLRELLAMAIGIAGQVRGGLLDAGEIADSTRKCLAEIESGTSQAEMVHVRDIADDAVKLIHERAVGQSCGISTGFPVLDQQINGLPAQNLIVLAARPSMGKTAFALNIANNVAASGTGVVAFFSLEMANTEIGERMIAIRGRMDLSRLRSGRLEEYEYASLTESLDEMRELGLYVTDFGGTRVADIEAECRRIIARKRLALIIIDYLQLIRPEDSKQPREQQIAGIARRLKLFAKSTKIPILALAQLNRGVENREDKRPKLSDLRESGSIEQDADIVMFLHRPDMYDPEDRPGIAEIVVAKNRSGPTGTVPFTFTRQFLRFEDAVPAETIPEMPHFAGLDNVY